MTARDVWTEKVECPICGNAGSVKWSEAGGRFSSDPNRHGKPSEGFRVQQEGPGSTSQRVYCIGCGVPVED